MYSSTAADRDVGLGFGWVHPWRWEIEQRRRELVLWSDDGTSTSFPAIDVGAEHVGPWGWTLRREWERYVLDKGDGVQRIFAAADESARAWRLVELRDRNDNRISLTYDEKGRLSEAIDSAGRRVKVLSTRAGRIASVLVYNARARGQWIGVARFTYNDRGDLTAAIDAEGYTSRYEYDDHHRLTRETDREGLSFCFVYDRVGRCIETWGEYVDKPDPSLDEDVPARLADGARARGVLHVRFDFGDGGYSEVADSTQVVRYTGNPHGLVEKEVDATGVTETTYDERGLVLARADGEGAVTRYERDARGRVVQVTDPLGRVTRYERDAAGLVARIVDPAGGVYELHRDGRGNVIHQSDPTGGIWSYTYDGGGLVTSATSPVGGVTRFAHDAEGNLTERTEPNGARWRWEYDLLGRCTLEVDPLGNETRAAWTDRGDVAAVFRGEGATTRYLYDGERRLTEIQEPGGRTTGLAWGGFHCLVQKTDPAGGVVRYRYDREGELTAVYNELGEVHRLRRNAAGLVVGEETFDGRRLAYRRDHVGRVVRAEVVGETTEYAYNAAGSLLSRVRPDETVEHFEYDVRGELVRASWPEGEVRFERDDTGRITREVETLRGEEHAVTSLYDRGGERVRRFTSRGHVEQIERDAMGERTRTILDEVDDVHHQRDLLGREAVVALPRGGRIHDEHDPHGRLRRRWATSPGTLRPVRFDDPAWVGGAAPGQPARVTAEREYRYDLAGDLSDALDRRRGWVQYDYDLAGRLLSVFHEATGAAERFRYDAAGLLYEDEGRDKEARAYGPGGRLLRRGATEYARDEAGRLVEKRVPRTDGGADVWRYTWDAAGRLERVDLPDGRRAAYAYDPFGRRVEAMLYQARALGGEARIAERTRFVWDGDTLVHAIRSRAGLEGDPIVEERTFCFHDESFVPWAQCDVTPDGFGGRRHAWSFFVNDPIGTPQELVASDGRLVAELDRRAWGRTQAVEGARTGTPLRFQGQYEDEETGLFYNRFRYYDPDAGLFISPDPSGLDGGLRPFGYVPNPIGWIDPLGLLPQNARQELRQLGPLSGRSKDVIEKDLKRRGYRSCPSESGGNVWTKPMPKGQTAVVRLDPAEKRIPPKGWADEVPHAHKEIIPSGKTAYNGNYDPKDPKIIKLDDAANPVDDSTDAGRRAAHIPIR
jgi:RHS repeat-associated protein